MTEQQRLEDLMKRLDRATAEAFAAYVSIMKSDAMIREVERLLAANRVNDAINLVDSHIRKFASVITRNYTTVAESTITANGRYVPRIAISFNPTHPRAVAQMNRQMLDLIQDISDNQRESIRDALAEAFQNGAGPRQAARAYRDAVGLTRKQLDAVKNYRRLLEAGSAQAFDRGLRDARFGPRDTSITARRAYLDSIDQSTIDKMVDAYEKKYLKYRAEVIARTESTRTVNEANDEAFTQTVEQAGFEDDQIESTWQYTHDSRTRDSHRNMQVRVVRGMNTPFVTGLGNRALRPGDPSLPAEDVIACRCLKTHRILRADEVS